MEKTGVYVVASCNCETILSKSALFFEKLVDKYVNTSVAMAVVYSEARD